MNNVTQQPRPTYNTKLTSESSFLNEEKIITPLESQRLPLRKKSKHPILQPLCNKPIAFYNCNKIKNLFLISPPPPNFSFSTNFIVSIKRNKPRNILLMRNSEVDRPFQALNTS